MKSFCFLSGAMISRLVEREKMHEIDKQNGPNEENSARKNEEIHPQVGCSGT